MNLQMHILPQLIVLYLIINYCSGTKYEADRVQGQRGGWVGLPGKKKRPIREIGRHKHQAQERATEKGFTHKLS